MWEARAQAILDVARGAALSAPVKRASVYPGPDYRRDCRLIGVHLAQPITVPGGGFGTNTGCATMVELPFVVNFTADCYPAAKDNGDAPDPDLVTAWSTAFYADAEAIYNAVADGLAQGLFGDCSGARLTTGEVTGPTGGTANFRWTITTPGY